MAKIVPFPTPEVICSIKISPRTIESVWAGWMKELGWSCYITSPSFDRLPDLIAQAERELKIAQTMRKGGVL